MTDDNFPFFFHRICFLLSFVCVEGGGGPIGSGGVAEYGNLPQQQQQQQLIYPSSGRGSSVPLTAGMGSSSGQQHQQFRRGASSSSWSDYRGDNFDKLNPQQQQQLNSVHPRSNPSLVKVRSSSYDHGDYYQDDYGRGQRSDAGQRLGGGVSSVERSLPVRPQQQQHLRQQRHPTHQHHSHHHHHRQHQSSSEEELRSTSECTSCEDVEVESESVSEKGKPIAFVMLVKIVKVGNFDFMFCSSESFAYEGQIIIKHVQEIRF